MTNPTLAEHQAVLDKLEDRINLGQSERARAVAIYSLNPEPGLQELIDTLDIILARLENHRTNVVDAIKFITIQNAKIDCALAVVRAMQKGAK